MKSLTYTLVVNGPQYGTQSARNAYLFAKMLIAKGHTLKSVFFYQDGVLNGSATHVPANDEFDLLQGWQKLAQAHNVQLETCVAAALRRGVVSEQEAKQHGLSSHNLASHFTQAGLGSLVQALLEQDRVVQF
ncbi:sulfurtransferase complex subunit TusD [Vibrio metoecus]|uniref:sulfurtransferase complex subunit TusD n=1 Tax=Vibrio metoecus TaxID=1481663 RepID=UPI000BA99AC6|nr:sulfurtransferase complex subunit TusD [Vibrio metoecus]PAR29823.1 sulfurtransferase complex subunit TusD [Vibrio metoecus]PAR53518.1 sulfurtransferase complex subunit TusD [Vibrio metoecus]